MMTGWLAFARTAASVLSRPSPVLPNLRNGFSDSNRPVRAGDDQAAAGEGQAPVSDDMAPLAGAVEARLTQAEGAFDDVGNVPRDPDLPLILERLFGAAGGEEARLEMLPADDAQMLWRDWRRVALHGREQSANSNAIDPAVSEKAAQRLA